MSYNIDNWKTKKLENLIIPFTAFFTHERKDWHPQPKSDFMSEDVTLECGCGQEIKGKLRNGKFTVTEFDFSGEGSGTFFDWILLPALKQSTGNLEAVLIWEGGDSVERLKVDNGKVTREDLDL